MKRYMFLTCFMVVFVCTDLWSIAYYGTNSISSFPDTDVIIANGATVNPQNGTSIAMNDTVYLHNNGVINGTINTNEYNLYVHNTVDNAVINVSGNGNIVQRIYNNDEITKVDFGTTDFTVQINNINNLNLTDIQNMNADSFTITDSCIVMDDFNLWQDWTKDVTLDGNISFVINQRNTVTSGTHINHTFGGVRISSIEIMDLDDSHKTYWEYDGSDIILYIVREKNYGQIFDDANIEENVLDLIRQRHPNDKLLKALDRANTIDEINRLKGLSYRFNHDIMLRPLKMLNKFSAFGLARKENDSGVGLEPFYIISNTMNMVGGRVYIGYNYDNLYFGMGGSIGRFNYSDDLNEFDGMFYGIDFKSKQTFDKFWLKQVFGFSLSDFHADYVSNEQIKNNPLGLSGYVDVSMGYDFNIDKDITFSPIAGVAFLPSKVADASDTESYVHGGADIKYFFVTDGIKYEYALSGSVGTNGDIFANARIGFMSVSDNAGVSFNAGVLKDDFDYYYRFSLDAKILF